MKIYKTARHSVHAVLFIVLIGVGLFGMQNVLFGQAYGQQDPIRAAWQRVHSAGSYQFSGELEQVTQPSATIENVGRSSEVSRLYIEGETRSHERLTEMQLWAQTGNTLRQEDSLSIRSEGTKTLVRVGNGEWQEREGFADGFAPQGDVMAYLVAARESTVHEPETQAGISFRRVSFTLDGSAFAAYIRDHLQEQLQKDGSLPPGAQIALSEYYQNMQGKGELWIAENGFPIRQILHLQFPEQAGETVAATITMNFSDFGFAGSNQLAALLNTYSSQLASVPFFGLVLVCSAMLIRLRGSRQLHRAVASVLIVSFVLGPLMNSLEMHSFFEVQAAKAATQEETQELTKQQQELQAAIYETDFDPHRNALEHLGADSPLVAPAREADSNIVTPFAVRKSNEDGTDTDGDGLTDFQEERVGTDYAYSDSDEDGLSDAIEVRGASLGGKMWYLDPNQVDTNKDGLGDAQEWDLDNNGIPDDTDSDGIPDAFDDDNDGDGVSDNMDLSPFTRLAQNFNETTPFNFVATGLTPNIPTFVDFQLRPSDPEHLWFAFNVLDWPGDSLGQIRDVDQKTYADLARASGRIPQANEANGDMKLIPMLEIRVPNSGINLPPQRDLSPYNITVNNYTSNASTKLVYVPLTLQTNDKTGMREAFTGRMRYLPTGAWPAPHQIRLAWVVQALVDMPCDSKNPADVQQGCSSSNYIYNVPQVIHTYYDSWNLTGLNIKEDQGSNVAIIYEDPAVDPNLKDEAALTALSYGLDVAFLGGRDQDNNAQRDITINEIARRFNRTSNGGISENQRWAIPNILRVETKSYSTLDEAIATTAMTETKRILSSQFTARWKSDRTIKPLLLFAQESRSRAISLDGLKASGGYMIQTGTTLTANMQPSGQTKAPLVTTNHLRWAPYCSPISSEPNWSECGTDVWWDVLTERSPDSLIIPNDDPNNPDLAAGRVFVMLLYASQLKQGLSNVVQQDDLLISSKYAKPNDPSLASTIRLVDTAAPAAVKQIANIVIMARFVNQVSIGEELGNMLKGLRGGAAGDMIKKVGNVFLNFKTGGHFNRLVGSGIILGAVTILASLATIVYFAFFEETLGGKIAFKVITIGISTFLSIISPILTINQWSNILKAAGSSSSALLLGSEVTGMSKAASVIGLIISVAITWGFFIYSIVSNNISAFSPEFNRALAETIATTVYTILLFVLSATLIGTLLAGIIAVIDAILTAICELGVDELRKVPGLGGACFTLGTSAIKILTYMSYSYSPMIDLAHKEFLVMGAPAVRLADPNKGFAAGNALSISLPVTTTVIHKEPDPKDGLQIYFYLWLFSKDNLRSSTFNYALSRSGNWPVHAQLNQMKDRWQDIREDHKMVLTPMYRAYANTTPPPLENINLSVGLNQAIPLSMNMGYAIPAYECWGVLYLAFCHTRELADSTPLNLNTMYFDIFPSTLDAFMTMASKNQPSGRGLAWGSQFKALKDSDGDGLLSTSQGGMDPDDSKPDSDGDGLADSYELEQRSKGVTFNPLSCDTDGDGLTDKQELDFGTDPNRADSDNDGLSDAEEVWHQVYNTTSCTPTNNWAGGWNLLIGGSPSLTVRVTSNPMAADTDNDGLSDLFERNKGVAAELDEDNRPYHPSVANKLPITILLESNAPQRAAGPGVVGPNQTFIITTTVIASLALESSPLELSLPAPFGNTTLNSTLAFDPLNSTSPQTVTQQHQITVVNNASSSTAEINSKIEGILAGDVLPSIEEIASLKLVVDADPPTSSVTSINDKQYVLGSKEGQPITYIIGGTANDTASDVVKVEVSVNNGPWQEATGTSTWTFGVQIDDGEFEIRTRATDRAGNVETPSTSISLYADGYEPTITFPSELMPSLLVPKRTADGHWTVPVAGRVRDPQIGMHSAIAKPFSIRSGVGLDPASLQVRLRRDGDASTLNEWQTVALNNEVWSHTYRFSANLADPTDAYWVELRASDLLGQTWQNGTLVKLDASAPIATLDLKDSLRSVISDTISLTGVITDERSQVGVDSLEASFIPVDQVRVWGDTILHLPLDEPAGTQFFNDQSGRGNHAVCSLVAACPTAGEAGRVDQAIRASYPLRVENKPSFNFGPDQSFTLQAWVKTSRGDNTLIHKGSGQQRYRLSVGTNGRASFALWSGAFTTTVTGGADLRDNAWHHIVGIVDRDRGRASLFVDGKFITSTAVSGDFSSNDPLEVAGQLQIPETPQLMDGMIDEVAIFNRSLSANEVTALYASADRQWFPATLAQHGAGISNTRWSLAVPSGLEGVYQINLRSKDMLGHRGIIPNIWRGTIDTLAPRVTLTAQPTGAIYFDPASNSYRAAVRYVCAAQDEHLDGSRFNCPGTNLPAPSSSFSNDPVLKELFPDITIRSGLVISYTLWQNLNLGTQSMRACDEVGHCRSASVTVTMPSPAPGAPQAIVINPSELSYVAASDQISVTLVAEADQPLREITLSLDGKLVETISFSQADNVKREQRTLNLAVANEGEHTLVARATDWTGRVQNILYPVSFTVDKKAPSLTINSAPITAAQTYGPGSDIIRFNGSVNDTIGLSAVQISINGSPFSDVTFRNGGWQTAQQVRDPEGKALSVTVRAIDLAGRVTELTRTINVEITTNNPPDTSITAKPNASTQSRSASFSFSGTPGEREIALFECKLDDGDYEICTSPIQYQNLSAGTHTFSVRAVDSAGFVDPSPATYTWTIGNQPQPATEYKVYMPFVSVLK